MMSAVKAADVKRGIAVIWENLQCPICLDLMSQPVSTRCDHQFCKFCMTRLLERNKRTETSCPVCKAKVTKRSLQESPGFQKLVEGLRNLVRSYEFDTSTNYFTGLPQRRQGASVETESRDQHCSGENTPTEGDVTGKEATLSSTAEAKDAFAKLMCLEDSRPDTAEQECLDGSHGGSAQKSEIKPADLGDVPLTPGACNSQTQQDVTPDDGKRSRRRSKRLCLEPDRIVDKRQKKSVQKVSEWLLKISPASDAEAESNTEGAPPISTESDGDRGSTASRASTEIHASGNEKADVSPGRAVPCRGLEEQVFGAVYKRERRVSKISKVIKSSSSEREVEPPGNVKEKDETIKAPKRRSSRKVSPAETASEDKEAGAREDETGEENGSLRSPGEPEQVVLGGPDENAENVEESPEFKGSLKKPGRRSRKMQAVWQDVDRDLAEKESNKKDRKRRVTRSNCDAAKDDESGKSKNAKYAKSLALVSAGTEIIDVREKVPGNPKFIETEVSIESYPSSAELKSPDARRTRRSLRLQEFTAEVQGLTRRTRSKQTLPKPAEEPEKDPTSNLDEPHEKTGRAGTSQPEAIPREKPDQSVRRRNGCVYNNDFENIEVVQSGEDSAAPKCVSEAEEHSLVSVVPDTVDQDKHILTSPPSSSSSTNVENSSPLAAVVPESLPQKRQEAASTETLTSAVEDRETEQEEDTNDSELDTEQLMKTFKATKRKSFYLGSPRTSHNRSKEKSLTQIVDEDKQERVDQPEIPAISPGSDQGLPLNACEIPSQTSQSCVADAVSVSLLQVKSPALPSLPKDSSSKTSGARDHPEKVAESQDYARSQVSRPLVNVELGNSIQLFSTSMTQGEPLISRSGDSIKSSGILEEPSQANSDVDPNKIPSIPLGSTTDSEIRCNNFESSVTPDGLVPHGPEVLTTEPVATQISDKIDEGEELSQPRVCRKRKAQRLESSGSDSSVDNEDFPPLAQILKSHQWPSAPDKEPLKTSSKQDGVHAEDRDPRPGSEPVSQDGRSRSEPEAQSTPASQRVTSYQKEKSVEDVNPDDVEDSGVPDPACRDEWISDSQGSVDLFGTPREGEARAEGVCTNTRLSIESSQYSSEILSTQQKQEMQQELHRLERMMALVSEALQKKDDDLEDKKDQTEDEDQHSGQRGRARSQRSCKSRKQLSQRSEVKGQPAVPEVLTVGVTEEQKPNESSGDAFGEPAIKNECRAESGGRMELVVSGLSAAEQVLVKKFARKMKAGVSSQVTSSTTHIIIKTDGNLVCERTLKYFQGIAGRKWVVSFLWISECFKHGKLLAEVPYEVCGDVVNGLDHSGPRKARTAPDNNLLMRRCEICFQGSFTDMSTDQMELMVEQCGATVVKDPLMFSRKGMRYQLVVVQPGPDDSQSYYTALQTKATVVTRSWLLDSVAMYTLQNPQDYKP